ncbi:ornithine cyclodeaminase family protein [Aliikangiella sp. IMCC44359]|uniref:ornithine cyclodeaminase family protein n=1 Tax=Aliikangiella sp. IMCC44359 TaxID=3459125 RepID=UPI00403AE68A
MKVLIVNQHEVREWLPMRECIDAMENALEMLHKNNAINPLRRAMWLPEQKGILGMMPAFMGDNNVMGLKAFSVMPGNIGTQYDAHQGMVMLFETDKGCPLAIMDASEITAIRTAAASAVATKLLAKKDAKTLTILGSGVQAKKHLEAILLIRDITKVNVWSRNPENAKKFALNESQRHQMEIESFSSAEEAVKGADIICTTTWAAEPILKGEWLEKGVHINGAGASVPFMRELDTNAVVKSRLYVDRIESTLNEAGDFLIPKEEGALSDDHIVGEIGEILINNLSGRESDSEITLFKSLGIGLEDVAAANHIYKKVKQTGEGLWVEFGELKDTE